MSPIISLEEAAAIVDTAMFVDVRKPAASLASGFSIKRAIWRHPFDALNWHEEFTKAKIIVYCVHGHELSRSVAGFLRDCGHDCQFLEGGFEAWLAAGLAVEIAGEKT